jgi:MoxR-like ATPase
MNTNEIKELIAAADICGHVPLIKGLHGLGKSESVSQYAKEKNMHYEPLILSLMDTGDMLGLPVTERVSGLSSTLWSAPSWYNNIVNAAWPETLVTDKLHFEDKDLEAYVHKNKDSLNKNLEISRGELNELYCKYYNLPMDCFQILRQNNVSYLDARRSVLFLDEFNRAPSDILNASLQLILDHRLHSHILPIVNGQETLIVAAINPANGDYTVQEFDPALLDRFVSCEIQPDFKSWLTWAKENKVNQIVLDFLLDNQRKFHYTPEDGSKGASPRSWTRLAHYLDRIEDTPKNIMSHYIIGTIGSALAAQFLVFYNNYSNNLTTEDLEKAIKKEILKEAKKGKINPQEIAENFLTMVSDLEAIRRQEFADTYIKKYINSDNAKDAMVMLVYLYALPLESLSAVLKSLQSENIEDYAQLAVLDNEANKKGLFNKLVSNLKGL